MLQYLSNKGVANIKASSSVKPTLQSNQTCFKYEIRLQEIVFINCFRRSSTTGCNVSQKDGTDCLWKQRILLRLIIFMSIKRAPLKAYFPPWKRALVSVNLPFSNCRSDCHCCSEEMGPVIRPAERSDASVPALVFSDKYLRRHSTDVRI